MKNVKSEKIPKMQKYSKCKTGSRYLNTFLLHLFAIGEEKRMRNRSMDLCEKENKILMIQTLRRNRYIE